MRVITPLFVLCYSRPYSLIAGGPVLKIKRLRTRDVARSALVFERPEMAYVVMMISVDTCASACCSSPTPPHLSLLACADLLLVSICSNVISRWCRVFHELRHSVHSPIRHRKPANGTKRAAAVCWRRRGESLISHFMHCKLRK